MNTPININGIRKLFLKVREIDPSTIILVIIGMVEVTPEKAIPPNIGGKIVELWTMERLMQFLKAPYPTLVTLFPILSVVILLQLSNVPAPIEVTASGIVMEVRLVHRMNARSPI